MKCFLFLSSIVFASSLFGDELISQAGWRLSDETIGPFRHRLIATSPDGSASYQSEFVMVNDSVEVLAELVRGEQTLSLHRCSYVNAGSEIYLNVYSPPAGFDATGVFLYKEVDEPSLAEAKQEYKRQDTILNQVYQTRLERLDQTKRADLQKRQRAWIEYKESMAEFQAQRPEGQERESVAYWTTASGLTESRIGFFKYVYDNQEISTTVSGTYVDERGGTMSIVDRGDNWIFTIDVVRGPTYHLGFVRGEAEENPAGARFEEWREDYIFDGKVPEIVLKRMGNRVTVEGRQTQAYHGARAYFDGEYFKVTDLIHAFPAVID